MTHTEAMRDALKDIEATVTAALAHQPEDEAKCGQFLYDALVKCFNIADLACHTARTESEAAVSSEAATTENSSAVGNAAAMREACAKAAESAAEIMERVRRKDGLAFNTANYIAGIAKAALATPPRNCDKYANHNDAMKAFEVFVIDQGKLGLINPYPGVLRWLFAPATEKEGGAK